MSIVYADRVLNYVRHVNEYKGRDRTLYIGRSPKHGPCGLGNPFVIGRDGNRSEVIEKYRAWLWEQIQRDPFYWLYAFEGMHEHVLLCHCHPEPCHGDVLTDAVKWAYSQNRWTEEERPTPAECTDWAIRLGAEAAYQEAIATTIPEQLTGSEKLCDVQVEMPWGYLVFTIARENNDPEAPWNGFATQFILNEFMED